MFVHIHIYIYTCIYIYLYIFTYIYICIYIIAMRIPAPTFFCLYTHIVAIFHAVLLLSTLHWTLHSLSCYLHTLFCYLPHTLLLLFTHTLLPLYIRFLAQTQDSVSVFHSSMMRRSATELHWNRSTSETIESFEAQGLIDEDSFAFSFSFFSVLLGEGFLS